MLYFSLISNKKRKKMEALEVSYAVPKKNLVLHNERCQSNSPTLENFCQQILMQK